MSAKPPIAPKALGFPIPYLGMQPVRLPVFWDDGDALLLEKPIGVQVLPDPWYRRQPVLIDAIRHQASQGKPEFVRAGIGPEGLWAVNDLDPWCAGALLCCRRRETADAWRNDLGSNRFQFVFECVTRADVAEDTYTCDLPLARHHHESRMLVSHTTGKTAQSQFVKVGPVGEFYLWQVSIALPRRHQVLLHAVELGLPVMGDRLYAGSPVPMLSRFKRDYRPKKDRDERPLYEGPVYRLSAIVLPDANVLTIPEPKPWRALLNQLRRLPTAGTTDQVG